MNISQIVIPKAGGPDVLRIEQRELEPPAAGELQVEVHAAGVNFADILARQGLYPDAPPLPTVVGYEVSGVVVGKGSGVEEDWVGREVLGLTRFGGYSSGLNAPVAQMFEKPAGLSHAEAASVPVAYVTAWQMLMIQGGLRAGDTLLIQNAGSGVGLAAIDIAQYVGARTIGTASSGKHSFLAERGLGDAVDYRTEDWVARVLALTDGRGVDLVVDPLGGESFRKSLKVLRPTGRLGMYGVSAASNNGRVAGKLSLAKTALRMPFFHPVPLMNDNRGVFGTNLGHMWEEVDRIRGWMADLAAGLDDGWIHPHVDSTYAFSQASQAHAAIEARKTAGKVVLVPDERG